MKREKIGKAEIVALVIAFMAAMAWVSNQDFDDQYSANAHYCDMVEQDLWGDYNKDIDCEWR